MCFFNSLNLCKSMVSCFNKLWTIDFGTKKKTLNIHSGFWDGITHFQVVVPSGNSLYLNAEEPPLQREMFKVYDAWIHMHRCPLYVSMANQCSIWLNILNNCIPNCQPAWKTQLMDDDSMKNKTSVLRSAASNLYTGLHFLSDLRTLGRETYYLFKCHKAYISVCLNIPIYSKTVSAPLEWIIDGKSRRWVISYDTLRFCLSRCVLVSLKTNVFNWQTDEWSRLGENNSLGTILNPENDPG